jgi:hypothetical protein
MAQRPSSSLIYARQIRTTKSEESTDRLLLEDTLLPKDVADCLLSWTSKLQTEIATALESSFRISGDLYSHSDSNLYSVVTMYTYLYIFL